MTFVAAVLLPDGVLLGADSRVTRGPGFAVDEAQKIVPLGDATAIGFAGDVVTVSRLFGQLYGPPGRNRRMDAVSVRRWLPRFLKDRYARLHRLKSIGSCSFLVASSVRGRPQRVRMRDVTRWATRERSNYLLWRVWNKTADRDGWVTVPGSSYSLLYLMESPAFVPRDFQPLEFGAVGSGACDVLTSLRRYAAFLFADHPGHAAGWFMEAMATTLASTSEPTVGGTFLTFGLSGGQRVVFSSDTATRTEGPALVIEDGVFVQMDLGSGLRIPLRPPGELHRNPSTRPITYPHYRNFWPTEPPLAELRFPQFMARSFIEEAEARALERQKIAWEEIEKKRGTGS
jgi:hypothetical protein